MMRVTRTTMGMMADIRKQRSQDACPFQIFRVNKNGSLAKIATDFKMTSEEADKKAGYLMDINPGSKYVVVEREVK